jgi:Uma2 family endonuclease
MTAPETATRRRFTVDEYHRMADAGILTDDDRVELINGEVIAMSPIGPAHMRCVLQLDRLFHQHIAQADLPDLFVSVQNPLRLDAHWEPEPDVALLHLPHGMDAIPGPDAARLVVEVADTTLAHDRRKAARYGQAGVPETWIVVLEDEAIEVHRQPGADGYAKQQRVQPGEVLSCAALPALAPFSVEALL